MKVSPAIETMIEGLRRAGLKLTPQRLAIVHSFAGDPTHPTAQEIFDRLRPALPTMSFATVYSTLDSLTLAGLCSARALAPGPARFDPNTEPHDHAVCEVCGSMRDIEPGRGPGGETAGEVGGEALGGFEVRSVETIYRGVCEGCRAAGASRGARR
jgi:Fur family peroxide stress response transcriptional regulator